MLIDFGLNIGIYLRGINFIELPFVTSNCTDASNSTSPANYTITTPEFDSTTTKTSGNGWPYSHFKILSNIEYSTHMIVGFVFVAL